MENNEPTSPVNRLFENAEAGILRVGPNSVLSKQGLFVNGERAELRHIEDFSAFTFNTSAAVCTVLETLFPDATGMPGAGGTVKPSEFAGWELYSERVILLRAGKGSLEEHGEVLLQWCLAAWCVVVMTGHEIGQSPEFLPINLLLSQGGQALATSVKQWEDYDHRNRIGSVLALLAGKDDFGDPRPRAIVVTIPWPEALGADLGGRDRLFENATRIASDIQVERHAGHLKSRLAVAGHYVSFDPDSAAGLVNTFDGKASPGTSAMLAIEMDGVTFRSHRVVPDKPAEAGDAYYDFRIIHHRQPSLTEMGIK